MSEDGRKADEFEVCCTLEYAIPNSEHFDLDRWASDMNSHYLKVARTNSTWVMTDGKTNRELGVLFECEGAVYSGWHGLSCGPRYNRFVTQLVGALLDLGATMSVRPCSREDCLAAQRLSNAK